MIKPRLATKQGRFFNALKKIQRHGFEAVFVGGCVRDKLLGLNPKDFDIATNAKPEELLKIFKGHNIKTVGSSFPIVLLNDIEIATYRKDIHIGVGDKNCTIEYADTLKEDLNRRDFTVNAMAYRLESGKFILIDPLGGQRDLEKRQIKFIGNPKDRIHEDPNRILRACRFAAKINGTFHKKTLLALIKYSYLVKKHVKAERIRTEIIKAMECNNPSFFFQHLYTLDILKDLFPSLNKTVTFNGHGYHHIETIFTHLMLCGDYLHKKRPLLRLSGFLHDVGKPTAANKNSTAHADFTFYKHEIIGAKLVTKELKKLKFSNNEINYISKLVRHHMHTLTDLSDKSKRRLLKKLVDDNVELGDIIRLKMADRIANVKAAKLSKKKLRDMLLLENIIKNPDTALLVKDLNINGIDVMDILHIAPCALVGITLKKILQLVIDDKLINKRSSLLEAIKCFK